VDDELNPATEPTGSVAATRAIAAGEVSHILIRGCTRCQSQRIIGEPCGTCGNPDPPEATRLGIVSAVYRNPIKRIWWTTVRGPLADRRIRKAGARTLELRATRSDGS
jgi:hypothetical protein